MVTSNDTYYLYIISNTIDSTLYIGITNNPKRRFSEHLNNSTNKHLSAAMELYGKNKFTFTIKYCDTRAEIDRLEVSTIKKFREEGISLYNISNGGLIGNGSPGEEHWNHILTKEDILHIRNLYASNICTQRNIAKLYNTGYKNISKIIRGDRWANVLGPITLEKQEISKVANRRILTDIQVEEVRNESFEEFTYSGKLDIPIIAELYNISRQSMRAILKGISYPLLAGPILGKDYYKDYGK